MNAIISNAFNLLIDKVKSTKETGWQFKVKNYRKVIDILSHSSDITDISHANSILTSNGLKNPVKILEKINEILQTGELQVAIKAHADPAITAIKNLTTIPEIGPAKATQLYKKGYTSVTELQQLDKDTLNSLLNRKQLIGLKHYDDLLLPIPRQEMIDIDNYLHQNTLDGMSLTITGSYRRGKHTSGDIDCLISHSDPECLIKFVKKLQSNGFLTDCFALGKFKFLGICKLHDTFRHIDILYSSPNQYPFAILYFTGSKEFNVNMRLHAIQLGYTLSEHGLGIDTPHITTEQDIFKHLELDYVSPCDR